MASQATGRFYPAEGMAVAAQAAHRRRRKRPVAPARPRLRESPRSVIVVLALVLLVGFSLRAWSATHPVVDPGPDAAAYAAIAEHLFTSGSYGTPGQSSPTDWSPGLPLLVAAIYHVNGAADEQVARLVIAGL